MAQVTHDSFTPGRPARGVPADALPTHQKPQWTPNAHHAARSIRRQGKARHARLPVPPRIRPYPTMMLGPVGRMSAVLPIRKATRALPGHESARVGEEAEGGDRSPTGAGGSADARRPCAGRGRWRAVTAFPPGIPSPIAARPERSWVPAERSRYRTLSILFPVATCGFPATSLRPRPRSTCPWEA